MGNPNTGCGTIEFRRKELKKFVDARRVHPYVLRLLDHTPRPQYYFLSMCKELIEQNSELQEAFFAELFCGDFGVPAALDLHGTN